MARRSYEDIYGSARVFVDAAFRADPRFLLDALPNPPEGTVSDEDLIRLAILNFFNRMNSKPFVLIKLLIEEAFSTRRLQRLLPCNIRRRIKGKKFNRKAALRRVVLNILRDQLAIQPKHDLFVWRAWSAMWYCIRNYNDFVEQTPKLLVRVVDFDTAAWYSGKLIEAAREAKGSKSKLRDILVRECVVNTV